MELQAVRGMKDLFGEEIASWNAVEQTIVRILTSFGYQEIRTPALESVEIFKQGVGETTDVVEKQMYVFEGDGKDTLALRPEGTAPFMRSVLQHQLHRSGHAQRFYYYLPMFRRERPQKGRQRQFFQFGAELINDATAEADAELIVLLDHIYRSLGLSEYQIKINSVGCGECRPQYRTALVSYFKPHLSQLCEQCQKRLERAPMRLLDCKNPQCQGLVEKAPLITDHLCAICEAHHKRLGVCLDSLNLAYDQDPHIVRGLDYYSRTAFEFVSDQLGAQSALVGGGRYDGLAERFGKKPIPAVGFALGMERLLLALEASQRLPQVENHPHYFMAAIGEKAFEVLYPASLKLKKSGLWTEIIYAKEKSLKALLKQADRLKAKSSIIVGDEELNQKQFILRDMKTGDQSQFPLADLEARLVEKGKC